MFVECKALFQPITLWLVARKNIQTFTTAYQRKGGALLHRFAHVVESANKVLFHNISYKTFGIFAYSNIPSRMGARCRLLNDVGSLRSQIMSSAILSRV